MRTSFTSWSLDAAMPCQLMKSACAAVAFCAALMPSSGREAAVTQSPHVTLASAFDNDDGTMFYDNGPMVFLRAHSNRPPNADWLKFETDQCGTLQRVDNRHSMIRQSALAGDDDDPSDDDPLDSGRAIVGQWLSQHSEIAVVNDGVDKSCDDSVFDTVDGDTSEIA
jgi:hypothetical protein